MPMTPEEYAEKEFNVPGWDTEEVLYAPGDNPDESAFDPNILRVLQAGGAAPEPETAQAPDPQTAEMAFEYNFTLPLAQRRAEVAAEEAKAYHLNARGNFWDALGAFIEKLAR